jgi:hypothetical protein
MRLDPMVAAGSRDGRTGRPPGYVGVNAGLAADRVALDMSTSTRTISAAGGDYWWDAHGGSEAAKDLVGESADFGGLGVIVGPSLGTVGAAPTGASGDVGLSQSIDPDDPDEWKRFWQWHHSIWGGYDLCVNCHRCDVSVTEFEETLRNFCYAVGLGMGCYGSTLLDVDYARCTFSCLFGDCGHAPVV